jgi:hypothetical protein
MTRTYSSRDIEGWHTDCQRIAEKAGWRMIACVNIGPDEWDLAFTAGSCSLLLRLLRTLTPQRIGECAQVSAHGDFERCLIVGDNIPSCTLPTVIPFAEFQARGGHPIVSLVGM